MAEKGLRYYAKVIGLYGLVGLAVWGSYFILREGRRFESVMPAATQPADLNRATTQKSLDNLPEFTNEGPIERGR